MSMFNVFLAVLSLAPLALLLWFWRIFPRDRRIHPSYRQSGIETIVKRTEVHDVPVRRRSMGEVGRKGKLA